MKHRTHEAVGCAVTLAICAATDTGPVLAAGAACASLLGSRLPDADQLGAHIHRRTRAERRSLTAALAMSALRLPLTIFAVVAKHRGVSHWLLSGVLVTGLVCAAVAAAWPPLALPAALGAGCGYLMHLLADACTPHGAPLLGPFRRRRVCLLPPGRCIRTGGRGDLLVLITATVSTAALAIAILQGT